MNKATITTETMYGLNSRTPSVILTWNKERGQLSPSEARMFALNILSAADAAESDAFLFEFTKANLKEDVPAAQVLQAFRDYRTAARTEE